MLKSNELVSCGVLVVPTDAVIKKVLYINSVLVREFGSTIALDLERAIPHATLHQVAMPDSQLAKWVAAIHPIVLDAGKLNLRLTSCNPWNDGGLWLDAKRRKDAFWQLHASIVGMTEKFRDHYILPHLTVMAGTIDALTSAERESLVLYGHPWANPGAPEHPYRPHITLGKVEPAALQCALECANRLFGSDLLEFSPSLLKVVKLGNHGTCGETVAAFPLAT